MMTSVNGFHVLRDPLLPGLTDLLNPRKVAELIADSHEGQSLEICGCEIIYLRYKPGTNCIIAYRLSFRSETSNAVENILCYAKIHTANDYPNAKTKIDDHKWLKSDPFQSTIELPESSAIFYFFPNDCEIDGLKIYFDLKKIQRILYEHYDKYPEQDWRISNKQIKFNIERYKPERRVVTRCKTKAYNRLDGSRTRLRFFLRNYADDRGEVSYRIHSSLYRHSLKSGDFSVPYPIAYIPERKAILMEQAPGIGLLELLLRKNDPDWIAPVARAIAGFHRGKISGAPDKTPDEFIAEARSTVEMLDSILPEHKKNIKSIFEFLSGNINPDWLNDDYPVHGDLYYGQILLDDDRVYLIDFDRTHSGDNNIDLGNFCAHLMLLKLQNLIRDDDSLIGKFLQSYRRASGVPLDENRLNFWIVFGLFQSAVGPFRRFEIDWPNKVIKIVKKCQTMISR